MFLQYSKFINFVDNDTLLGNVGVQLTLYTILVSPWLFTCIVLFLYSTNELLLTKKRLRFSRLNTSTQQDVDNYTNLTVDYWKNILLMLIIFSEFVCLLIFYLNQIFHEILPLNVKEAENCAWNLKKMFSIYMHFLLYTLNILSSLCWVSLLFILTDYLKDIYLSRTNNIPLVKKRLQRLAILIAIFGPVSITGIGSIIIKTLCDILFCIVLYRYIASSKRLYQALKWYNCDLRLELSPSSRVKYRNTLLAIKLFKWMTLVVLFLSFAGITGSYLLYFRYFFLIPLMLCFQTNQIGILVKGCSILDYIFALLTYSSGILLSTIITVFTLIFFCNKLYHFYQRKRRRKFESSYLYDKLLEA